jgi:hypothetical protein
MSDMPLVTPPTDALWVRVLKMIIVALGYQFTSFLIGGVAIIQIVLVLTGSGANERLKSLGRGLARYQSQNANYFTFVSDVAPFPFTDWPSETQP